MILTKVLRNNPTFRNFLSNNIGGLLWWPPTLPPPGGQKILNFFSPNFRSHQKNMFCLLQQNPIINGFSGMCDDNKMTRFWQDQKFAKNLGMLYLWNGCINFDSEKSSKKQPHLPQLFMKKYWGATMTTHHPTSP